MEGEFSRKNCHPQKSGLTLFVVFLSDYHWQTWEKVSKYFLRNSVDVFVDQKWPATHLKISKKIFVYFSLCHLVKTNRKINDETYFLVLGVFQGKSISPIWKCFKKFSLSFSLCFIWNSRTNYFFSFSGNFLGWDTGYSIYSKNSFSTKFLWIKKLSICDASYILNF